MLHDAFYFLFLPAKSNFPMSPKQEYTLVNNGVFVKVLLREKTLEDLIKPFNVRLASRCHMEITMAATT